MDIVYIIVNLIILISIIIYFLKDLITLKSNFKHRFAWKNCNKLTIEIPIGKKDNLQLLQEQIEIKCKELLEQGELNSGSMLLIQNNSDPVSIFMRLGIYGRFSHSAMILNNKFFNENGSTPLLWQAAGEKIFSKNNGPDIHSLSKFLAVYMNRYPNCRYVIRCLSQPLSTDQTNSLKQFILSTIKQKRLVFVSNFEMFWCFYTETLFRFLLPLDSMLNIKNKCNLTFCSKLITETYQHINLIDKDINSFASTPNCFSFPKNNNIFKNETELIFKYI